MGRETSNRDEADAFLQLASLCDHGVLVFVSDELVYLNEVGLGVLGATRAEQVIGQTPATFGLTKMREIADGASPQAGEIGVHRLDGSTRVVQAATTTLMYNGQPAIMLVLKDIAERQRLEGRLQFLTRNDLLTELPNRSDFRDRLGGAMARASRNARQVAVLLLNIDRFKQINLQHDASVGDQVLQEVARRLKSAVRQADSVGRIAGDEFGLILEAIDQRDQAAVVANRVLASIKLPVEIGGAQIEITASAGIAAFPVDTRDLDTLLRMADVAMYAAKEAGTGLFRFYFAEFEDRTRRDQARRAQIAQRVATLTEREREVMDVLVDGNSSKAIGYLLGASPRTIENHRAKVMAKMEADSLPDLVRMALDYKRARL